LLEVTAMGRIIMDEDRLFPSDPAQRQIARRLYGVVRDLPIVSPHGHTDPRWYAENTPFPDPASLFLIPDHYLFRMLYSKGVSLESLGIPRQDGGPVETDPRKIWRLFAEHYYLFRGTPSRMWLEHVLHFLFGIDERLDPANADAIYDRLADAIARPEFRPRALFERFNIEALCTTDSPLDTLEHHQRIAGSGWKGRVLPCFRPDSVVDPEFPGFANNVARLGEITGEDTATWQGYLKALAARRRFFKEMGCTSTDHGHPSAVTADLDAAACQSLLTRALKGELDAREAEFFRGQMLTEMVGMSLEDGLVIQIHPGSFRNHNERLSRMFGRDKGADIPTATEYTRALKPLLDRFGNEPNLTVVLFMLDETALSRELAPLAGHYPILRLGPPWWFYDSPEGMMRFKRLVVETAGFYNTVGFNDDTRAFLSIPARHDMARRVDCAFLAELVSRHQLDEDEAAETAVALAYGLAKEAYKF
jgi:glucuronate isomerase